MVTGSTSDGGVPHGELLVELSAAVAGWRWNEVAALRNRGCQDLGPEATSDAILVASGFNGIHPRRRRDRHSPGSAHCGGFTWRCARISALNAFAPPEKW